jgi:serine/threonine protein kinase/Tol biopolymer transport system component
MDERWQQIERLYHEAREMAGSARAEFLAKACAGDDDLRREVQSLLVQADQHESFMQSPAIEVAAESLVKREDAELVGTRISHYHILRKLGGGMGVVYEAEDTRLGRRVALKFLPQEFATETKALERFQREARAAAALNHPNICTIYEVSEHAGRPFIAMELLEGRTLRELISNGGQGPPLPLSILLDLSIEIADALDAAHQRGIIHRDIKPRNVFVIPRGGTLQAKILDFGLAKWTGPWAEIVPGQGLPGKFPRPTIDRQQLTTRGVAMGTVAYMSPEQARGETLDARTDLFSFGAVLYEMATGRQAFSGDSTADIFSQILKEEPPSPRSLNPELPAKLQEVIGKCLEKDCDLRYQHASEIRTDLKRLKRETSSGRSASVAPVSPPAARSGEFISPHGGVKPPLQSDDQPSSDSQMVATLVKRHKGKVASLGVLIAAGIIVGGYAIYRLARPAEPPAVPPSPAANMQITQVTTSGTAEDAAISPDGRYVTYVENEPVGRSIWLRQIATGSTVQIVPTAKGVTYECPAFTPGGDYVDFLLLPDSLQESPDLYRVPVLGGPSRKLLEHVDSADAFSPDGKRMAFVRDLPANGETQLVVANADGSNAHVLAIRKRPKEFHRWLAGPDWSPDGKLLAVGAGEVAPDYEFYPLVVNASSGREQQIGPNRWFTVPGLAWLPDGRNLLIVASELSSPDRRQIWQVSYPDGKVSRITNDLNNYFGVNLTANGGTFATVQSRINSNIWIGAKGGWEHPRQVTQGLSNTDGTEGLSWTADGKVVYTSAANGILSLWQVNPGNGETRKLVQRELPVKFPALCGGSGTLTFITSSKGGGPHIWRSEADGSGLKQLTHGALDVLPSCSPDGKWVVYESLSTGRSQLWKVSIDGGKPVQLSREGIASWSAVSPDGKWIAFKHRKNPQSPSEFAIMPFAGGKLVKTFPIAPGSQGFPNSAAWMPDSRAFAYLVLMNGVSNIVAQPINGGQARQLTHYTSGNIFSFDLSRDRQLVLARGAVSKDIVLIRNFQ